MAPKLALFADARIGTPGTQPNCDQHMVDERNLLRAKSYAQVSKHRFRFALVPISRKIGAGAWMPDIADSFEQPLQSALVFSAS